jgi:hypothetical protein
MDLTRSLKPVLLADAEQRLNEPPPTAVSDFLAEPYALDQEQIEHYRERGFVKLEQVISGEALRYFREVIGYAVGHYFVDDDRAPADKRVYERSFLQAFNLGPIYPAIQPFAHAFRFADLARRLMGIRGVRLWFDQALYKQPGGRLTDYHKDAAFWPVQPARRTPPPSGRHWSTSRASAAAWRLPPAATAPHTLRSSSTSSTSRRTSPCPASCCGSGCRSTPATAHSTPAASTTVPTPTAPPPCARR